MKSSFRKISLIILKILLTISFICYIMIFIEEIIHPFSEGFFGVFMIYTLFIIFMIGYYFLWTNEKISGIIIMSWYGLMLIIGFFVWSDAGMVILLGFPVFIFGILLFIHSLRKTKKNNNLSTKSNKEQ